LALHMEYWNIGFSKEFTHFLTPLSSVILAIRHCTISPEPIIPWPRPELLESNYKAFISEILR